MKVHVKLQTLGEYTCVAIRQVQSALLALACMHCGHVSSHVLVAASSMQSLDSQGGCKGGIGRYIAECRASCVAYRSLDNSAH